MSLLEATRWTCTACHRRPRAVGMPRSLITLAIPPKLVMPSAWIASMFAALADRMRQRTDLAVRLGLDVRRAPGDTTRLDALLRRFAEHFVRQQWPGPRLPEVFYDPRSLAEVGPRAARQPSCEMRSGAGRQGRGVVDDRSTSGKLVFGVARRRVLRKVLTGFPARRSPPRCWFC